MKLKANFKNTRYYNNSYLKITQSYSVQPALWRTRNRKHKISRKHLVVAISKNLIIYTEKL